MTNFYTVMNAIVPVEYKTFLRYCSNSQPVVDDYSFLHFLF